MNGVRSAMRTREAKVNDKIKQILTTGHVKSQKKSIRQYMIANETGVCHSSVAVHHLNLTVCPFRKILSQVT